MPSIQSRLADPATRNAAVAEITRRDAPARIERAAGESKDLTFRISTAGEDRYNSTIDPKGWKLDQYRANPVVLWMHNSWEPPIGRSKMIEADDEGLVAVPEFVSRDVNPLAGTVEDMLRAGFLNAASVSWQPDKWAYNEKRGGVDFIEQTLLEWSIVTVPGNADALMERSRALGIDTAPMRAFAERVMRATGSKDAEAQARAGEAPRTYVFMNGKVRIESPSMADLIVLSRDLGMAAPARLVVTEQRADEPKDEPKDEPVEEPAKEDEARADDDKAAEKCACGREYGADDKFCAACGEKRAEPSAEDEPVEEPKEEPVRVVDADAVLAALKKIGAA